jgi:NAD-dependent dihydropyrimidine dehydrogenase PreA subunit
MSKAPADTASSPDAEEDEVEEAEEPVNKQATIEPPENDTPKEVAGYVRRMLNETQVKVLYHHGWCKKCFLCVEACPRKALAAGDWGYPILAFPERCVACGMCEYSCPDLAVTVLEAKRRAASKAAHKGLEPQGE